MATSKTLSAFGLSVELKADRTEFVESCASTAAAASYMATAALAGKVFDDTAKTVEVTGDTAKKVIRLGGTARVTGKNILAATLTGADEIGSRVLTASTDKVVGKATADYDAVVRPRILSFRKNVETAKVEATRILDEYCGDTVNSEDGIIALLNPASES